MIDKSERSYPMNDNGDEKVKRTIEPCPMRNCGREIVCIVSTAPGASGWCVMCGCGYRSRAYNSSVAAIDAHNALSKKVSGYDEAVRLLRDTRNFSIVTKHGKGGIDHIICWKEARGDLLARIDKTGGGE